MTPWASLTKARSSRQFVTRRISRCPRRENSPIQQAPRARPEERSPDRRALKNLKSRELLDQTLIIWGGEFGRTPDSEGAKGRDHHSLEFSMWLAGGGVKGGLVYGATDELGMQAVSQRMHVHDLHATIMHLMGLNHEHLTYRYSGRDFRLTDVSGRVAPGSWPDRLRRPGEAYLRCPVIRFTRPASALMNSTSRNGSAEIRWKRTLPWASIRNVPCSGWLSKSS